ncbi:hypothetical protein ALC56_11289 [Trachymyrmex septentrionalis]|uniref:Uncharacterized protein n=1 Tax=Trachymyrmex septentrionalis TaxID=34720 RepID=A0A195F142_9HYME|nr:hypothetical protein ALC56_11289 [Trachymyrmex septentrionalis]
MDMRGCAATPRRPSGHLQKQNGYLVSQRYREMAAEPCCPPAFCLRRTKQRTHIKAIVCPCMRNGACLAIEVGGRDVPAPRLSWEPSSPPLHPLWWVAATSAVFLHVNVWRCIAPDDEKFWKELKKTTAEWNKRKAETKLRSFLVLGVSGGC